MTLLLAAARAAALDAVTPDPEIQRAVAAVPTAKSAAEMEAALADLETLAGDADRLVPQLLYFSMHATGVREGMTAGVVIDRLRISRDQLFRAIVPYLDTSDDGLQRQLRNVLGAVDEAPDPRSPDFSRYIALLRQRRANPPLLLVTHMFDTAPERAIETLADALIDDVPARRAVLHAAKSTDAAAVERLAADPAWWVRLYLVTRLQREPALRTPALMRRLGGDAHPAVRSAAGALSP